MKRAKTMHTQYVTAKVVREMFGGISHMSLHRWLTDTKKDFPKPSYIGSRRYFKLEEVEAFKRKIESGEAGAPQKSNLKH